jgi:hypothetical protein
VGRPRVRVALGLTLLLIVCAGVPGTAWRSAPALAAGGDPDCLGSYGALPARSGPPLRFGVDPGLAGSAGGLQLPAVPDDPARDVAATKALRPPGRVLVVRLNRLFWSGGDALIAQFRSLVASYTRAGLDVELQVRYHPPPGENGDLIAWQAYVRHVVDTFGPNRHVVAMTITNEVNLAISPNTSDGAYADARAALVDGIEAAHAEAARRGFRQLRFGFTYAYRFSPPGDAALFAFLGSRGGAAFRAAVGFVGLDFYPGSVYPPALLPGESLRADMAQALGVVRRCLMPMAGLGATTPIWITENGIPTGLTLSEPQQASDLRALVGAARAYSGTFGVTDYRWFNLRDSSEDGLASLPGVATTFATDGLLRADYAPKPSFAAYRAEISALGERTPGGRHRTTGSFTLGRPGPSRPRRPG